MGRFAVIGALFVLIGMQVGTGPASAQAPPGPPKPPGPPANPPRFAAYLNLAPANGIPAVNYYGIVRPQMQLANQLQTIQQNQAKPVAPLFGGSPETGVITGNPFGFQNYQLYFQNQFNLGQTPGGGGLTFGLPVQPVGMVPGPWKK